MKPTIHDATHVAFDMPTVDRLSKLGAMNVVRASGRLIVGPNRLEPEEHARVRAGFFGSPDGDGDQLDSSEVRWQPPVAVWLSGSLQERVSLWRVLHRLHALGIPHPNVFPIDVETVAPAGVGEGSLPPFDCGRSVADHPDAVLLERLATARSWPRARHDRAVSLWESYVAPNPLPFVRSCVRGMRSFPELEGAWSFLSAFFPRKVGEGGVRLSRYDELLLRVLSSEWQTPVKVFIHDSRAGNELFEFGSCAGDVFLANRLAQWAQHGDNPPVERVAGPRPGSPMLSWTYRITERGVRLREEGLAHLADAPILPVAGVEAYAPDAPWVLLEDGQLTPL